MAIRTGVTVVVPFSAVERPLKPPKPSGVQRAALYRLARLAGLAIAALGLS